MAIATTMNLTNVDINNTSSHNNNNNNDKQQEDQQQQQQGDDEHEHDMVMPGFRFHPTEEELVEFYLRRKVEGKKFNVELITFLDLYRYDPWELPALAAIGEKEWFFYVPRDRKYRNGDRPNRVTTSGYWKATGADRMIRGETSRPIGLKKTLVFYSGKAPKGIRTSWIMNEYRLPQHETERYQKAEISLCRVYKRPGVEDHPSVPRGSSLPSRLSSSSRATSSSSDRKNYHNAFRAQATCLQQQMEQQPPPQMCEKVSETDASSSTEVGTALGLSRHSSYTAVSPLAAPPQALTPPPQPTPPSPIEVNRMMQLISNDHHPNLKHHQVGGGDCHGVITSMPSPLNTSITHPSAGLIHHTHHQPSMEDIHRLVEYQQACINHHFQQHQQHQQHQQPPQQQHHQFQFETLSNSNNPSSSGSATNNLPFLFSNYLLSPAQAQVALINNPPTAAAAAATGGSSSSLQLPPVAVTGAGGGLAFSDRSLWDWNPYPEQNRDHFSNLFK